MSSLSTHVLDTSLGRPGQGIRVSLEREGLFIGSGVTNEDGRVTDLHGKDEPLPAGEYRLRFYVADYFAKLRRESFYTEISVTFRLKEGSEHYHVPLLLSPYGYSTYRGS